MEKQISRDLSGESKMRPRLRDRAYCPICEKLVRLASIAESIEMFRSDNSDITRLAEERKLHRLHNRRGEVMICSDSLFATFDSRQTRLLKPDRDLNEARSNDGS
jgi:hypothetical protein